MINTLVFKIRNRENPVYNFLYQVIKKGQRMSCPSIKAVHFPLYYLHLCISRTGKTLYEKLWAVPIFKAKCNSCGRGLRLQYVPRVRNGNLRIFIGENVNLNAVSFEAGRINPSPELRIGDRVNIGRKTSISINEKVEIGDDTSISWDCFIADSDGHPISPERRLRHEGIDSSEIKPVYIGKNVWIGAGSRILKGVTVGDNSIVATNSVVTKNVPPNTIIAGNPAKVVKEI